MHTKPRIIIIGAGFGGMRAAKTLNGSDCDVIVIDKKNHHLFQPLLYQVAISALSPGDIAAPIRTELRDSPNIKVYYDEVIRIDRHLRIVVTKKNQYSFDYLIVAVGTEPNYFGNDNWIQIAPGLKTLNDALMIREKILKSFEAADKSESKDEFKKNCTFVIVGGGPTGVELAGSLREIAERTIIPDFTRIKKTDVRIILIDGSKRLLTAYPQDLSAYTKKALQKLGVDLLLEERVIEITAEYIRTDVRKIETNCIIWAAGNKGVSLLTELESELDGLGRIIVEPDFSIQDDENIFVIGDAAFLQDRNGKVVPGIAPAANQAGEYVADIIRKRIKRELRAPFVYRDKGQMATIGRAKAVGLIGKSFKIKGFVAWLAWGLIHIFYLIDFRNRIKVMLEWFWFYITYKPGAQLILKVQEQEKEQT